MVYLMLKNLPRYECLLEAAKRFPDLDPTACEAFLHLLRAADDVFRECESNLADHGLSRGRFTVLMQLWDKEQNCPESKTPAELADLAGVTRATMTGLVDTLERDGLVKREHGTVDRRMMSVSLTQLGQELLQKALPPHFQKMSELMRPLSRDERKTLVGLLTKIGQRAST